MSTRRFLGDFGGMEEWFLYDETEDRFAIHTTQDVTPVLEANKRKLCAVAAGDLPPSPDMRHVARIPLGVVQKWIETYGVDPTARGNEQLLARLLDDPEWAYLRTAPGRIGRLRVR